LKALGAFLVLGLACACAPLQTATDDAQLVREIVQANLAEIAAGRLAVEKARSRTVREYGRRMVEEHRMLQVEASELRSAKGVPLPTGPDRGQQAQLRKLEALSGEAFERSYMEQALQDHAETLELLERAASRARDPALAAYAERALPRVRRHLELARHAACSEPRNSGGKLCGKP
jgi:putative membrane protein